jgi:hypothetical protein
MDLGDPIRVIEVDPEYVPIPEPAPSEPTTEPAFDPIEVPERVEV